MPSTGDRINHYEIEKLLGKGGMGEVYLAQDTRLDRKVAIKFLPPELEADELTQTRFIREAKAAAALDHPFICKVYESGEYNGISYIVMEYVEGKDLRQRMESKHLSLNESLGIAVEIAESLEKAHKEGIIHRDLKPANIMLTPQGHVKVMDFGLAKKILPSGGNLEQTLTQASITEKGTIAGTLAYMSPEQAKGKVLDGRSDIFSLGIIIYEMFSHKHPFSKTTPIETLSAILRDAPPTPNVRPKTINPLLRPILKKTMAKDPGERYQNISELVTDLRKAQRQSQGGIRLPLQGIPLYIASAALVAIIATGIFFLARRPAATPKALPDPVSVLIADFENKTGDQVFDGALEYAMGIGLEAAPFVTTYKRTDARKIARQIKPESDGKLDSEMTHLVCVREGITMFMDGAIEPRSEGYALKVWARDPTNPEKSTEYSKTIPSKAEVLTTAAWMANKVISDLGGTPTKSAEALAGETFSTSSLEAMNAYTNAQELQVIGKQEEAIQQYLKAIDLDPNFGRAYSGLALVYRNRAQFEESEQYFTKAFANISGMGEREKYRTMAIYYLNNRNFQQAIQELTELLAKYPADYAGRLNLALAYFFARDFSQAKEVGRKAVELYPANSMSRLNLSWYALADGDLDLAEQEAQTAIDQSPGYEKAHAALALAKFMKGEPEEAGRIYETLKAISPFGDALATLGIADIALYEGRVSAAVEILEKKIASDAEEGQTAYLGNKLSLLAYAHLQRRNKAASLEAADRAVAATKEIGALCCAAQIYIEGGKKDKAHAIAAELSSQLGPESKALAKIIEGEILRKDGNIHKAIELFNQAQEILGTWLGSFSLGKAYLEIQAFPEAHRELDVCLTHLGEAASVFFNDVPTLHYQPLIYYYLGRAQEGLGSPAAAESYRKFLEIKANADEGDPLVEDCLRRLAR